VRGVQDHDIELGRGSAFNGGWYGYVQKDLRNVLGRRVRGRYSRRYCGGGNLGRCREALADSLRAALRVPQQRLYPRTCSGFSRQMCHDTVRHSAVGVIEAPEIHWINRPTFQQVVEVERRAPR
jgi:hypothetical protein